MNIDLSWDHIRFFIAVHQAGSVVKAAATLGVSHATVLRNISRLERSLGITLFDRLQSGYRITPQGEDILEYALGMQEQADKLVRRGTGRNPAPEGILRLAVPDSSLFDLVPLLVQFRAQFPLISVQAQHGTPDLIADSKADLAFVLTNNPPDALVGRQLEKIEFAYYASPVYPESDQGNQLHANSCEWITWCSESADKDIGADWQEDALRHFSRQPNIVFQAANHDDALCAVREGMGVSLLRKPQPGLIELAFKSAARPVGVWMLTHHELRRSGRLQAFMQYVVGQFSARH